MTWTEHLLEAAGIGVSVAALPRISMAKPYTYGSRCNYEASMADRAADARWSTECVVASRDGCLSGLLPLHRSRSARAADPFVNVGVERLDRAAGKVDARGHLFIGLSDNLVGGALVRRHRDRLLDDAVLYALFQAAALEARQQDLRATALFVPAEQAVTAAAALAPLAALEPGAVHSRFELRGHADLASYSDGLTNKERYTLRTDAARSRAVGVVATAGALNESAIPAYAHLIAQVKRNNGLAVHPRLVEMTVRRWWQRSQDVVVFSARQGPSESLVGVCLGRVADEALELYEVGVADGVERHTAYIEVTYLAPLRFALARRLASVELGAGHAEVKRHRGAVQTVAWDMTQLPRP